MNKPSAYRAIIATIPFTFCAAAAATDAIWDGPAGLGGNGNWTQDAFWSGGVSPDNNGTTYNVFIDGGKIGSSVVTLNTNATIDMLTVDLGDTLALSNSWVLTLATGSVVNNGSIQVNAINAATGLTFQNSGTLTGSGTIALGNNASNRILTEGTLIQGVAHTIEGSGQLLANSGDMVNHGIIRQTGSVQLVIDTLGTFVNDGTLEAVGSGGIKLLAGTYELGTASVTVKTGSKLDLEDNVVVRDTRLVTEGSGVVNVNSVEDGVPAISAVQFENVVSDAQVLQGNTEDSHLSGTFTNNGTWTLAAINSTTDMTFADGVTIDGTGTIALGNNASNRILTEGTLIQGVAHTIEGSGQLLANSGDMVNHGIIRQTGSVQLVIDPLATFTNNGTLEAAGTGGIKLVEGIYEFGSTMMTVKTDSKLDLEDSVVVRDVHLVTEGSGVVNVNSVEDGDAAITAVQFENVLSDAQVLQDNTEDSHLSGTFTNNGTWTLAAINSTTDMTFADGVTIDGTGTIALGNNASNRILTEGTLIQGVAHTIEGSGQLLANSGDMVNHGIIRQTGSVQLVIDTLGTFVNDGTLEAVGSGGIKLLAGTYELGTASVTVKTGSKLDLEDNVVVRDTRLVTEGSGVVNVNSVEDGVPAISAVQFENVVSDAQVLQGNTEDSHLSGTFTNNGTWTLAAINSTTDMTFADGVTIDGTGTIALGNNASNRILTEGTLIQGVAHTIEGSGQLLANSGDMVNHGIIRQTGSVQLVIDTLGTFVNDGTLEAVGSGGIKLLAGTYELGTASVTVKTGSKLDLEDNVVVRDTRLVTEGSGVVNVNSVEDGVPAISAVQFENVVSDAQVLQGNTEDSHLSGTFTNNGTWTLTAINSTTDMTFADGVTIDGTGTIALGNNASNRLIATNGALVNGAGHTISGAGQVLGDDFLNQGAVLVDSSVGLTVASSTFTNEGTVEVTNKLTRVGDYVQTAGLTVVNGELETTLVAMSGGVLNGSGLIDGDLLNTGGLINVGNSAGELDVDGTFEQSAGTFLVEIAGNGAGLFDILDVSGNATLGGMIDVDLLGYTPSIGEFFDVLFAAEISGNFANAAAFNADNFIWMAEVVLNPIGDDLVRLSVVAPVPLPAAVWMLLSALGLLGALRRRVN